MIRRNEKKQQASTLKPVRLSWGFKGSLFISFGYRGDFFPTCCLHSFYDSGVLTPVAELTPDKGTMTPVNSDFSFPIQIPMKLSSQPKIFHL